MYYVCDMLTSAEQEEYRNALAQQDFETVKDLQRTARKRYGGGIPAIDEI